MISIQSFEHCFQRKVVYIKRTSEILRDKYSGDIPRTVPDLCSLPGEFSESSEMVSLHFTC